MNGKLGPVVLPIAMLMSVALAYGIGREGRKRVDTTVPKAATATSNPTPDDTWALRQVQACNKECGPVPFEVECSRGQGTESFRCTCGRPDRIVKQKVPPPPLAKTSPVVVEASTP